MTLRNLSYFSSSAASTTDSWQSAGSAVNISFRWSKERSSNFVSSVASLPTVTPASTLIELPSSSILICLRTARSNTGPFFGPPMRLPELLRYWITKDSSGNVDDRRNTAAGTLLTSLGSAILLWKKTDGEAEIYLTGSWILGVSIIHINSTI